MNHQSKYAVPAAVMTLSLLLISACVSPQVTMNGVPADSFDLSHWAITVPTDSDGDGKVDTINEAQLAGYVHPDFFYLDEHGRIVFTTPNKAVTTRNSSNTRSELRFMSRGGNVDIKGKAPANNFSLKAHSQADQFASIGSRMEATLHVNAVALNAGKPEKFPAYSAVVGQIHAVKFVGEHENAGWGNEPLKIFYKKFPNHDSGSVFWAYERNLAKNDPNRTDIAYPVWGNTWDKTNSPGSEGINLGEEFSYVVDVDKDIMHLTFTAKGRKTVEYTINLADNVDAYGKIDDKDFAGGYAGDQHYFKAGAYNQCNAGTTNPFWGTGCGGTGDWGTDFKNGDYTKVTFTKLKVTKSK